MARTRADAAKKAGGKASNKAPALRANTTGASVSKPGRKSKGSMNKARKTPVPEWQREITGYLGGAGSSTAKVAEQSEELLNEDAEQSEEVLNEDAEQSEEVLNEDAEQSKEVLIEDAEQSEEVLNEGAEQSEEVLNEGAEQSDENVEQSEEVHDGEDAEMDIEVPKVTLDPNSADASTKAKATSAPIEIITIEDSNEGSVLTVPEGEVDPGYSIVEVAEQSEEVLNNEVAGQSEEVHDSKDAEEKQENAVFDKEKETEDNKIN